MALAPLPLYLPVTVEIPGYGKLSLASHPDAPLLMVFGGIDVAEREINPADHAHAGTLVHSGVYMWKYFHNLHSRFHIFVANTPAVNGTLAYRHLLYAIQWKGFPPAVCPAGEPPPFSGSRQILYLFSGGYRPGMNLLKNYPARLFSNIFLVDIWMRDERVGAYYDHFAGANPAKTFYIHTSFGAVNPPVMNSIVRKLGSGRAILVKGRHGESDMQTHLRTNEEAVSRLPLI